MGKHATKSLQESAEKLKAAQDELTKLKSQSVEQLKKYEKRDAIERKQLKESHSLEVAKLRQDMDADAKKKIGKGESRSHDSIRKRCFRSKRRSKARARFLQK